MRLLCFSYTPRSHGENEGSSPMKDELKTSQKLVEELASAKQRIAELERAEKEHLTIIQNIRDGVYMLDSSGKFAFVNDVIVERSGFPAEWFLGRSYLDVVSKEDRERVESIFNAAKDGRTHTYEISYPSATGKPLCVEVCAVPLLDGDKVIGRLGISRDVTKRKQAEKAFQGSEERFRLAAESTADLIWEWDIRTDDLSWFGPIDKALGYDVGEFPRTIGAWESIIHPDDHARHGRIGSPSERSHTL
jgi:PAS domain S-box-containing protein